VIGQSEPSTNVPAGIKYPNPFNRKYGEVPYFFREFAYVGIGYSHRISEDPNVILCVWDMIFESVLK